MENTGRIRRLPSPTARRILFGLSCRQMIDDELLYICEIDYAHLVMLAERSIVDRRRVAGLLRAINHLIETDFEALRGRPVTRGIFLLYEDYLIETQGSAVGGILQTARSRNDLGATITKMRLRGPYTRLLTELLRFQAILLRRAERYFDVVMPLYTHGQAAEPSTYGHYLAGFAQALARDLDGIVYAARGIQQCPLGSCAIAGTSFPIDTERTAQLLGFDEGPTNSIDAIASRDLILRLLAAAAICGVTVSRLATDLLEWTTVEFGLLKLPDELVGSSSAMPQKRNPFLLEHIIGRTASGLGAFLTSAAAMRGTPFTNCIAVGTEAVRPIWSALDDLSDMVALLRVFVARANPDRDAMTRRAKLGFTVATALANKLVVGLGLDFRSAHKRIGQAIAAASEVGANSIESVAAEILKSEKLPISIEELDPAFVVRSSSFGGGPGFASMENTLKLLKERWVERMQARRCCLKGWLDAEARLEDAVRELCQVTDTAD